MSSNKERNSRNGAIHRSDAKPGRSGGFRGEKSEFSPARGAPRGEGRGEGRGEFRGDHRPERDGAGQDERRFSGPKGRPQRGKLESYDGWLWGIHAVEAALKNPARKDNMRLVGTEDRLRALQPLFQNRKEILVEVGEPNDISRLLPASAVHQGVALKGPVLEGVDLGTLLEETSGVILMLDQITDPQNVGTVFRSAAAFGVKGIIMQDRHAPEIQGALAKTAVGAADIVPFARVTNLSRALEELKDNSWRVVGLAGEGTASLAEALAPDLPTVIVLGSEGDGIRRLVAEKCDDLARIPMPGGFESLNVANACAIALYEALGRKIDIQ